MLRIFTIAFLTICSGYVMAQENQSELDKRNGFKDIKLGMAIDSLKGTKFKKDFKERDEFDAKLYDVEDPAYQKIGEVEVKSIQVKTYKNLIYEISVVTPKDPRIMKALESIYGKADYDMKAETYFWKSESITLKFHALSKHSLEMAYFSKTVSNMMKADKAKKVEAIAEDF